MELFLLLRVRTVDVMVKFQEQQKIFLTKLSRCLESLLFNPNTHIILLHLVPTKISKEL